MSCTTPAFVKIIFRNDRQGVDVVVLTCCVCVATQRVCVRLAAVLASETCREIRRLLSAPFFYVSLAGGE